MAKIHKFFSYYDRSKPKRIKNAKKTTFFIPYDVTFEYICVNKNTDNVLKHAIIFKK